MRFTTQRNNSYQGSQGRVEVDQEKIKVVFPGGDEETALLPAEELHQFLVSGEQYLKSKAVHLQQGGSTLHLNIRPSDRVVIVWLDYHRHARGGDFMFISRRGLLRAARLAAFEQRKKKSKSR